VSDSEQKAEATAYLADAARLTATCQSIPEKDQDEIIEHIVSAQDGLARREHG